LLRGGAEFWMKVKGQAIPSKLDTGILYKSLSLSPSRENERARHISMKGIKNSSARAYRLGFPSTVRCRQPGRLPAYNLIGRHKAYITGQL
jgi:hypothetical protein